MTTGLDGAIMMLEGSAVLGTIAVKNGLWWNGLKTLHLNRANLPCKFWISMLVSLFSTHYNRDRARPADVLLDAGSPRLSAELCIISQQLPFDRKD